MEPNSETTDTPNAQWQLVISVAGAAVADGVADEVIAVPADLTELGTAPIGAADLRARAAVAIGTVDTATLSAWAYLSGLAGRLLDVLCDGGHLDVGAAVERGRSADGERPNERIDRVAVTGAVIAGGDSTQIGEVRWARRCTVDLSDVPGAAGIHVLAWLAGVRDRRGDGGRFPQLDAGDGDVIDLEGVRLDGAARRRSTNAAAGTARADAVALTDRQRRLIAAADVPIESVLRALGSGHDGDLWNCPRPDRHTHGDAVPSAKVSGNQLRCFRCDTEWTDPLRLVMDACDVGPDDAATLLLDGGDPFAPWREKITGERERRSAA